MYKLTNKQLAYGLNGLDLGEMAVSILETHYVHDNTVAKTAELYEVSRQYVYELERKFQTNLKKKMRADNLEFVLSIVKSEAVDQIRQIEGFN
jgi:predicted DNA-binding protein YlxM (UPF0122 family)